MIDDANLSRTRIFQPLPVVLGPLHGCFDFQHAGFLLVFYRLVTVCLKRIVFDQEHRTNRWTDVG